MPGGLKGPNYGWGCGWVAGPSWSSQKLRPNAFQSMVMGTPSMAKTDSWLTPSPRGLALEETPTLTTMSCGPWEKDKVRK